MREFNKAAGRKGHLWQGRYRSTVVEAPACFLRAVAYFVRSRWFVRGMKKRLALDAPGRNVERRPVRTGVVACGPRLGDPGRRRRHASSSQAVMERLVAERCDRRRVALLRSSGERLAVSIPRLQRCSSHPSAVFPVKERRPSLVRCMDKARVWMTRSRLREPLISCKCASRWAGKRLGRAHENGWHLRRRGPRKPQHL